MNDWKIFKKESEPHDEIKRLLQPPSWRRFSSTEKEITEEKKRGATFQIADDEVELVNAALYLRRPLLVEGKPGTGKTSLAYAIAYQLSLGKVLRWNITTRSTLKEGLYSYDAVGRLQSIKQQERDSQNPEANTGQTQTRDRNSGEEGKQLDDIGKYVRLGAVGTALYQSKPKKPRVLLIDEIDKSDIDLPNNLLHIFEEGQFNIDELARIKKQQPTVTVFTSENEEVDIEGGKVPCQAFPFVILTSNGERDFPPPFLRRCIRLTMPEPDDKRLKKIVRAHFKEEADILEKAKPMIEKYQELQKNGQLATDQLLNAIYLVTRKDFPDLDKDKLVEKLLQYISNVL